MVEERPHLDVPEARRDDPFATTMRNSRMPMLITDPRQDDNPVVFCNDSFLELTGYSRDEVVGRNCRFLQGPGTEPATVAAMHRAIAEVQPSFRADILNYRKDGAPFWNALFMSPVFDDDGRLLYFFASQRDVSEQRERERRVRRRKEQLEAEIARRTRELQRAVDEIQRSAAAKSLLLHEVDHRVKNNLQMISALMQLQARYGDDTTRAALGNMLARVEALSRVHRRLYHADDPSRFDIATFTHDLVLELIRGSGREDIRLELDLEPIAISAAKAAPLALMVNELIVNAIRHAVKSRGGRIAVRVGRVDGQVDIEIEDDGAGMLDAGPGSRSFGRTILDALARQLRADVELLGRDLGTHIRIRLPIDRGNPEGRSCSPHAG